MNLSPMNQTNPMIAPPPERKSKSWTSEIWDWTKSIALALFLVLLIHHYMFNLSTVKGHSMEPTLQDNEWLFVNKIGYYVGEPKRHDVVIVKDPSEENGIVQYLVKRIIALPGDSVEVRNKKLYVNGKLQIEPYTDAAIEDGDYGPLIVPKTQYFIMGDNRHKDASKDSRVFGTVPADMIEGKAQFILWPLTDWSTL